MSFILNYCEKLSYNIYNTTNIVKNYIIENSKQKEEDFRIIFGEKITRSDLDILAKEINEGTNIGNDGNFDWVTMSSLEFRGVNDLYNMVMYKLLFVYLVLLSCIIWSFYIHISAYVDSWEKVVTVWKEEKRLITFIEAIHNQEKYKKNINFNNKETIKVHNKLKTINSIKKNGNRISIFFIWMDSVLVSSSFWVYYSKLEFIWTLIPCIILLFISVPSFTLALALDEAHKPASWIKVIGNQWYWIYEYSTYSEDIVLYSNINYGSDLNFNSLRVLEPDISITIVNNKFTRFLITSSDVIHCWAVPSLGIKVDACPGRINSVSILPTRVGVYYGQCSEICGVNHGFMPICVEVVA